MDLTPIQPANDNSGWYSVVDAEQTLEQGDLLNKFVIVHTDYSDENRGKTLGQKLKAKAITEDVVILTQSCDLDDFKDEDLVILCPRYEITKAKSAKGSSLNTPQGWGDLRKGALIHLYLLDKCGIDGYQFDYQVIDLRKIYSVPLGYVKKVAVEQQNRVRLISPYKEHLSQAFARQFMRIGLPQDLPRDFPYKVK